jgi:hypothetical protein
MDVKDRIKSLVEQRVIEAARKQMNLKLSSIAKQLGKPIISQSVFSNYLPDVWALPDEDIIYDPSVVQTADEDWNENQIGYSFDGLKFGVNLCINILIYEDKVVEIKTTFNGYLVYAEIEGDIEAYAPFPAWEDYVEMFYQGATEKEKDRIIKEYEDKKEEKNKRFKKFWESFRGLWGY